MTTFNKRMMMMMMVAEDKRPPYLNSTPETRLFSSRYGWPSRLFRRLCVAATLAIVAIASRKKVGYPWLALVGGA